MARRRTDSSSERHSEPPQQDQPHQIESYVRNLNEDPRYIRYLERTADMTEPIRIETVEPKTNIIDDAYIPVKYLFVVIGTVLTIAGDAFILHSDIKEVSTQLKLHEQEYILVINNIQEKNKELSDTIKELSAKMESLNSVVKRQEDQILTLSKISRTHNHEK